MLDLTGRQVGELADLEWGVTIGLGGYTSGAVSGMDHGLRVAVFRDRFIHPDGFLYDVIMPRETPEARV